MPSVLEGRPFDESVALTISKLLLVAASIFMFLQFEFSLNAHQSFCDNNILQDEGLKSSFIICISFCLLQVIED